MIIFLILKVEYINFTILGLKRLKFQTVFTQKIILLKYKVFLLHFSKQQVLIQCIFRFKNQFFSKIGIIN